MEQLLLSSTFNKLAKSSNRFFRTSQLVVVVVRPLTTAIALVTQEVAIVVDVAAQDVPTLVVMMIPTGNDHPIERITRMTVNLCDRTPPHFDNLSAERNLR